MEINPQTNKGDVENLVKNLLSRDPVLFNSTLNAYFETDSVYHGHALDIKGVSQIKHAAWLFNALDWGRGAQVHRKDLSWDQKNARLTVRTTRHLRSVFLLLFTFSVPVKTIIQFSPDGSRTRKSSDKDEPPLLYVTHWEDQWPVGHAIETLPLVGSLLQQIVTPILSFFFVLFANLSYNAWARVTTLQRHWVRSGTNTYNKRADRALPKEVKDGFEQGANVAKGWGDYLVATVKRASYHPLQGVELLAQTTFSIAASVSPFPLPGIAVFDPQTRKSVSSVARGAPLSEPIPVKAQTTLHSEESHAKRSLADAAFNPRGAGESDAYELPAITRPQSQGIKPATVEVGPSVDGSTDQQATYNIPAQQYQEGIAAAPTKDQTSSSKATEHKDTSLFDAVHSDPKALHKAEAAAEAATKATHGGSEAPKKKKKKNAEHPHPPKFTDSLDESQVPDTAQ